MKRFRRHLNPPMVVSAIALFVALGGGYATAFSGSGSLQKAAEDGIAASFEEVRTLTGFGVLQARCEVFGSPDGIELQLDNTTSKTIGVDAYRVDGEYVADTVPPGSQSDAIELPLGPRMMLMHLFKPEDGNKAQVDVTVSSRSTANGNEPDINCSISRLRIEALNTQE